MAFAGDTGRLVTGGDDATLRVWDVESGECVRVIKEHQSSIVAACYNHDVQLLATLSEDGTIKLWQDLLGPSNATLPGREPATRSLAFSHDGRWLAWGGRETWNHEVLS